MASILDTQPAKGSDSEKVIATPKVNLEEAAWGEDEIDIDTEEIAGSDIQSETVGESVDTSSDIFVPPSAG